MIRLRGYAEACDRNRAPILAAIRPLLEQCCAVLEVGSGTGQHAVYFAEKMPHLIWHTSDREANHADIQDWLKEAALINTRAPLSLDVSQSVWPVLEVDAVFSANSMHIMSWANVELFFAGAGRLLAAGGLLLLYGPFNYGGQYTSESNWHFDQRLKQRDSLSGLRDFEAVDLLAQSAGMVLQTDYPMPANNHLLCWRKLEDPGICKST